LRVVPRQFCGHSIEFGQRPGRPVRIEARLAKQPFVVMERGRGRRRGQPVQGAPVGILFQEHVQERVARHAGLLHEGFQGHEGAFLRELRQSRAPQAHQVRRIAPRDRHQRFPIDLAHRDQIDADAVLLRIEPVHDPPDGLALKPGPFFPIGDLQAAVDVVVPRLRNDDVAAGQKPDARENQARRSEPERSGAAQRQDAASPLEPWSVSVFSHGFPQTGTRKTSRPPETSLAYTFRGAEVNGVCGQGNRTKTRRKQSARRKNSCSLTAPSQRIRQKKMQKSAGNSVFQRLSCASRNPAGLWTPACAGVTEAGVTQESCRPVGARGNGIF
jgi:hypothetical protein